MTAKSARDTSPFETRNKAFLEYKKTNPDATYADFTMKGVVESIKRGGGHNSLGPRLHDGEDWWAAGKPKFQRLQRLHEVARSARVVDYGCGSLRVGAHYIAYLEPERYFGLDVNLDLIAMGKELVGTERLAEKRPRFGGIDPASIDAAHAFGADFVFSHAVCQHVHPDEAAGYFGNLARIASKPGCVLLFNGSVSDQPVRQVALSWPKDRYIDTLKELKFVSLTGANTKKVALGEEFTLGMFMFRRE